MPTRAALASAVAVAAVHAALLPPLLAMRAVQPRSKGAEAGEVSAAAGTRAAPPLAARFDDRGRARRLYFPAEVLVGAPEERARQILALASASLGIPPAGGPELALVAVRRSAGGPHVRFQQRHANVPLWGAEAVVSFDATRRAAVVASDLESVPPGLPGHAVPRVSAAGACSLALHALDAGAAGASRATPPHAGLWWRRRDNTWSLEHRVTIACAATDASHPALDGDWEIWVDAATGVVREKRDRTVFAAGVADGRGRVFLPDPVLASGDRSLADGGDDDAAVPEAAYVEVPLRELAPPLRGSYRLVGPHVRILDWESPTSVPDSSPDGRFLRRRSDQGFEDVMAYYHLDAVQRWYQQLGFHDANRRVQEVDPHGMRGQDNSKFVPSTHRISLGEGGVDDAEDASVLVHEYGHATQYDIVPTWGTGGHAGAMGEGFGDYLANSWAWALFPERVADWNGVFWWDGHNEYWPGRRAIDPAMHYPEDAAGSVHRAGTLWCSALTDALYALGDRVVMDRLVLDHHYALTGSATMEDAANAILASDVTLYQGAHLGVLVETFGRWGLVDAAAWRPLVFDHLPLDIAIGTEGPLQVAATVVSTVAAVERVVARVRPTGGPWAEVPLAVLGTDRWEAAIPAPGGGWSDLEYYLEARDTAGNLATVPALGASQPYQVGLGLVAERFESDTGWQAGLPDDDAVSGRWVRVAPVGTIAQPGADHTRTGTLCFVTANAPAGAPASEADVDGGRTTLLSPVWDLGGASSARLSYWRWFSNDQGSAPGEDAWVVEISNDGGITWKIVESTTSSDVGWRHVEYDLGAEFGVLHRIRMRCTVSDAGTGSLVEAALDDVLLQVVHPTEVAARTPLDTSLLPASPNPCVSGTRLRFALGRHMHADLAIYDARGRCVRRLVQGTLPAGPHEVAWDGRDARGLPAARGVYLVRLVTSDGAFSRKLAVVR